MLALALVVGGARSLTPSGSGRHSAHRTFPSLGTAEPPDTLEDGTQPAAAAAAAARHRPAIAHDDPALLLTSDSGAAARPIVRRQKIPPSHDDVPPY
jgi:hypothetical protein